MGEQRIVIAKAQDIANLANGFIRDEYGMTYSFKSVDFVSFTPNGQLAVVAIRQ